MACQLVGFGRVVVAVPGVLAQVVVPPYVSPPSVHAILIEALPGNTGRTYVGVKGLARATLANCLAVLPIPTANMIPTFSITVTEAANGVALASFYFDADVGGEGVMVSAIIV